MAEEKRSKIGKLLKKAAVPAGLLAAGMVATKVAFTTAEVAKGNCEVSNAWAYAVPEVPYLTKREYSECPLGTVPTVD